MKRLRTQQCGPQAANLRTGATLTEVLISLLAMGIGVVTIASLFPISVLRSVQGTQLTNATLLRYNAEALIDIQPRIVLNPDNMGGNNFSENYIVDPLGYYVVDNVVVKQNEFGNGGSTMLTRYNGGFTTERAARAATVLPDSWVLKYEDVVTGDGTGLTNSITLANTLGSEASQVSIRNSVYQPPSRVVISNLANTTSVARFIHEAVDNSGKLEIRWKNEDSNNNRILDTSPNEDDNSNGLLETDLDLPTGFVAGTVRIETQETRYSYILSVRQNSSGRANVNVVVFFRRAYGDIDEHVYSAGNAPDEVTHSSSDPDQYNIEFAAGNRPFVKKGGFMLDVDNVRWYRIQKVVDISGTEVELHLETPPRLDAATGQLDNIKNVMFPRGIIDVFPIETKG